MPVIGPIVESDILLAVEGVTVSFDGFKAVNDLSLYIQKGELRVIANPIRVDGERLAQAACSPLGADNDSLLGRHA